MGRTSFNGGIAGGAAQVVGQQRVDLRGPRKLGRVAETAVLRVVPARQLPHALVQHCCCFGVGQRASCLCARQVAYFECVHWLDANR